jgi:DNA ligase 1
MNAAEQIHVRPGNPVRAMLAQRLSDAAEILAKLGGECAAEYKYDGVRVQAHRIADGVIELTRRCSTCRWACSASSCCTPTART